MEFDRESAAKLLALLAPRRKNEKQKATQKRKLQGAAARQTATAALRAAVMFRADGRCELEAANQRCVNNATELDHWLSGTGRRQQKQSVETTWALCRAHHVRRTRNYPNAAFWNELFADHCARYGYPFTPHVEHAQLPGRAAR
jgi:hypothetical protein